MILVVLETPYAGDIEDNIRFARACMHDCFLRNEAAFASHLLYTQPGILQDNIPEERKLGMEAGMLWSEKASKSVVYTNLGISSGMKFGIERAIAFGRPIEYRILENWK